jgi:diaminopimelate decarboxylase
MHHFAYRDGQLHCEDVPIERLARAVGTPFYLYSHATLRRHFEAFDAAFSGVDHLVCYSAKANAAGAILRLFAGMGGGLDIVSGGELHRGIADRRDRRRPRRRHPDDQRGIRGGARADRR